MSIAHENRIAALEKAVKALYALIEELAEPSPLTAVADPADVMADMELSIATPKRLPRRTAIKREK